MPAMPANARTDLDLGKFRHKLEEERKRLVYEVDSLDENVDHQHGQSEGAELSHYDQHQADAGTETFLEERDLSMEANARTLLETVDQAMERLEKGTFGLCTRCEKPIGTERLEALPWTPYCIECASDLEMRI